MSETKIRNGMQTALTPVGLLKGHSQVQQAASDLDIATFLGHLLHGEILPSIGDYHDDDKQDQLIELADKVTEQLSDPDANLDLVEMSADPLTDWKTNSLPNLLAAWQRDEEAPASVFALAAIAVLIANSGLDIDRIGSFDRYDGTAQAAAIKSSFPGANATEAELTAWLRGIIEQGGFFDGADPAQREANIERLATAAAADAQIILTEGVKTALKANFQ